MFPAISNEYFCSIIIMLFFTQICFPRLKISFFIPYYWLSILSLSFCFMEFTFLLRCSTCRNKLLHSFMVSVKSMFFFLVGSIILVIGEEYFTAKSYGSFCFQLTVFLWSLHFSGGSICSPSSMSPVSLPESFIYYSSVKRKKHHHHQKLRISTQFASLQLWEC